MIPRPASPPESTFGWHPEPQLLGYVDVEARPALERLGRDAWQAALDYLYAEQPRRPLGPESYRQLRRRFFGSQGGPVPAPSRPDTSTAILDEFRRRLAPFQFNAGHPRSYAYFTPPPLAMAVVGELLAQWLNQSVDIWQAGPSAAFVEEEVVAWLRSVVGIGEQGWGVLTSGGVMANVMALMLARDVHLKQLLDVPPSQFPRGSALSTARIYASDQAHFSIARAIDILGFPPDSLHVVPSDEQFRLPARVVSEAIAADREAGFVPLSLVASVGTTNTGSIDPISELSELAARERLWLHVDAAYGGAARLSARDADRVPDLERADSVTIDPHKWFFQPCDVAALVVQRKDDLHSTFSRRPEYYRSGEGDEDALNWFEYSMEGTRRFRALKLWMSWKHLGSEGLGRLVEQTNDLAAYLASRVAISPEFEAQPSVPDLSVVCFRHVPPRWGPANDVDPRRLDRHQDYLQHALAISGEAWVSTTRLRGSTYLRAGIVNYFSAKGDIDRLLGSLSRLAAGDDEPG